jgi:Tfp pilus assembly protein PilO
MDLNVDLKKLNDLDLKALVNAPNSIKLVALAVILGLTLFAGYWFIWRDELAELNVAKQDELTLKNQYSEKANQSVNLEAYRLQLGEVKQSFQAMLSQLPINSSFGAILSDINQAGLERGLNFEFIKPGNERVQRSEERRKSPAFLCRNSNSNSDGWWLSGFWKICQRCGTNDPDCNIKRFTYYKVQGRGTTQYAS